MRRQLTEGIARLWRGAHWSKEYGEHPGTVPLIMMIAAGCVAGADRHPAWGPFLGGGVMAAVFGPLWLVGCWHRGDRGTDAMRERETRW